MARTQNTITGRMSGSIGGIRFSTWKGINVAASKPETVANPQSLAQREQRGKMRAIVSIYRQAADHLNLGYQQQAVHMSGFNSFVSENIKNGFITPAGDDPVYNLSKFIASKGTLTPTVLTQSNASIGSHEVALAWTAPASGDQDATDVPYCIVINDIGEVAFSSPLNVTRASASLKITLPDNYTLTGQAFAYLFFYQKFSRKVSSSAARELVIA